MIHTTVITRPPAKQCAALARIGSAVVSGALYRQGIRSSFICGPRSMTPGVAIAGPALTLQFMPKREDLYGDSEYAEPEKQLHRHALYHTRPGDIVVVDAAVRRGAARVRSVAARPGWRVSARARDHPRVIRIV